MNIAVDPFRTIYDPNHERVRRMLARIVGPLPWFMRIEFLA
jgi:hypothetical protein